MAQEILIDTYNINKHFGVQINMWRKCKYKFPWSMKHHKYK